MITLSHPTGNQNVRQVLQALNEKAWLDSLHTTLGWHQNAWCLKIPWGSSHLKKRAYALPQDKVYSYPYKEIMRLLLRYCYNHPWTTHESGRFCVDAVYRDLDQRFSNYIHGKKGQLKGVYAYEDGALESFQTAQAYGITTIYELPIAYGRFAQNMLQEEAQRLPAWEITLVGNNDSERKLKRKTAELEHADIIICPSHFVKQSIPAHIAEKKSIHIIPYGCHTLKNQPQKKEEGSLKVLFAGSMSQRKGLADVFSAFRQLHTRQAELHILGAIIAPMAFYRAQYPDFHYHPPRPHTDVLRLMRNCDVLLLPSLVEGRALVQLEALSCGLPLIITPNTGGDDLIEEGITGFQVPIRSPEAIAAKINWFIQHRAELAHMRTACIDKARTISWKNFRQQLIRTLQPHIASTC